MKDVLNILVGFIILLVILAIIVFIFGAFISSFDPNAANGYDHRLAF